MLQVGALRNTRVFQEAKEEGREEGRADAIPLMLEAGVSLDQMAQRWGLELSEVEDMAIAALKRTNTPETSIAERLNLSLSRVQSSSKSGESRS